MIRCMGCMAEIPQNAAQCPHCGYLRGTPPMEAYHLQAETILQGRYIVGRVLGYGGFGVTYIGWDAQLERIVAIKEFLPSTFATRMPGGTSVTVFDGPATEQFGFGLQRFLDEAHRLAQFNGIPGITDIYDTFSQNATAYIVMQFLNGQDVKAILAAKGPMPYEQAREIILKICDTLAPVHQTGIIHRDLSPDNIYLTREGEVKLLDFGAARYESGVNSKSLSVILKPGYAPEEQYRSKGEQGSWTDVYALAATFYKMLTGVTPPDSLERAVQDELKEPSKMGIVLPQSAENALMNALNIRKNDRTQTLGQFKEALLADGVERVKVKPVRAGAARLPLAGRIAIGLAALALVAGGIALSTLGGEGEDIVIGEAAKLTDNYGNALADGQALVPSITGLGEAEAAQALEDAGLVLVRGEARPSPSQPKNAVLAQTPEAGAVVDEGGEVTVSLSAGTFWEAYDEGMLPQFEGITAHEAVAAFHEFKTNDSGHNYYAEYSYEHSGSVSAGSVIRYDVPNDDYAENNVIQVIVSAGAPGGYHVRAPFLQSTYVLVYAAPEIDHEADESWPETYLEVSPDGSRWHEVMSLSDGYLNDVDRASGYAPINNYYFGDYLLGQYPELLGETLQLRIAWRDEGGGTQQVPLPQALALEAVPDEGTRIDSMQFVTWEELEELDRQGVLNVNNSAVDEMQHLYAEMEQSYWGDYNEENEPYSLYNSPPVVVRGVFGQNRYEVTVPGENNDGRGQLINLHNNSSEDGTQIAAMSLYNQNIGYKAQNGESYSAEVMMFDMISDFDYEPYSADGTMVTARVTTPHRFTITPSPALAALLGAPPAAGGGPGAMAAEPAEEALAEDGYDENMMAAVSILLEAMESGALDEEEGFAIVAEVAVAYGIPIGDLLAVLADNGMTQEQIDRLRVWMEIGGYAI